MRYGTIFKNPDLASVFETLARERGRRRSTRASSPNGSSSSRRPRAADSPCGTSATTRPTGSSRSSTNYRGYDVWEIPPNGQGIATLQILNLLEHFDIGSMQPNSAEHLHLFIEAKKLAFEDRAVYYADMDFAKVPLQELISKDYAAERVKLIDRSRAAQTRSQPAGSRVPPTRPT